MREIKFRGKRYDNGEWAVGDFMRYSEEDAHITVDLIENETYQVKRDTVGQFTGLCDKNGKEIYEGDIVTATYGRWREEPDGLQRTCKVVYDNKSCSFRLSVRNSMVLASFGDTRKKDIEVIGNLHDSPNLLTQ